jgi:hypothetical protein
MSAIPYSTAVSTFGLGVAIAAGVLFSPARVSAECGDYVHIRNSQPATAPDPSTRTPTSQDDNRKQDLPVHDQSSRPSCPKLAESLFC